MSSKTRDFHTVRARHCFFYIAHKHYNYGTSHTGKVLDRHHATALWGIKVIEQFIETGDENMFLVKKALDALSITDLGIQKAWNKKLEKEVRAKENGNTLYQRLGLSEPVNPKAIKTHEVYKTTPIKSNTEYGEVEDIVVKMKNA